MPVSANGTKSIASNFATRTSTSYSSGARGTTGMQQGTNNYNSPSNAASRTGTTTNKNSNTGKTGTGGVNNVGRGGSSPGGGLGFGNDPAMGTRTNNSSLLGMGGVRGSFTSPTGLLGMGGQRGSLTAPGITSMLAEAQRRAQQNRFAADMGRYGEPPPDRSTNVGVMDTPRLAADPTNGLGRVNAMAPQGGLERYADMTLGGKFGAGSTQLGMAPKAPQAVTDPYGGMGKMGMMSGQTSPYNEPTPPTVARINPDGTLSMIKDQSRLPGMEGPKPADRIAYPSEEGQIYSPASLANYMTFKDQSRVKEQDRLPQAQPPVTAQNYGFQGPQPTAEDLAAQERQSYVNQWRQSQIANNAAHRGIGQTGQPTTMASVEPTATAPTQPPSGSWMDAIPGAGLVKDAVSYVDENLVQPTKEQIEKYGGFERAGQLARVAVGIMNVMPDLSPYKAPPGNQNGNSGLAPPGHRNRQRPDGRPRGGPNANPPPVTPPVNPPVNPAAPQWFYPQYQSQWAGLPVGLGGTYGRTA